MVDRENSRVCGWSTWHNRHGTPFHSREVPWLVSQANGSGFSILHVFFMIRLQSVSEISCTIELQLHQLFLRRSPAAPDGLESFESRPHGIGQVLAHKHAQWATLTLIRILQIYSIYTLMDSQTIDATWNTFTKNPAVLVQPGTLVNMDNCNVYCNLNICEVRQQLITYPTFGGPHCTINSSPKVKTLNLNQNPSISVWIVECRIRSQSESTRQFRGSQLSYSSKDWINSSIPL